MIENKIFCCCGREMTFLMWENNKTQIYFCGICGKRGVVENESD